MTGCARPGADAPPASELRWRLAAACAGQEGIFFGPDSESRPARDRRVARAKAVCAGCPVIVPCLEFASATQPRFGVWAGGDVERVRPEVPEGAVRLCPAELHWMTAENSKPVAGTTRFRCRECLNAADRRTALARRDRARRLAAEHPGQVAA